MSAGPNRLPVPAFGMVSAADAESLVIALRDELVKAEERLIEIAAEIAKRDAIRREESKGENMSHNPKLLDLQFLTTKEGTEISLRELFAAAALIGYNANPDPELVHIPSGKKASWCYYDADAMLAERTKEGGHG